MEITNFFCNFQRYIDFYVLYIFRLVITLVKINQTESKKSIYTAKFPRI